MTSPDDLIWFLAIPHCNSVFCLFGNFSYLRKCAEFVTPTNVVFAILFSQALSASVQKFDPGDNEVVSNAALFGRHGIDFIL